MENLLVNVSAPWQSSGMRHKGPACRYCRFAPTGTGFIGDSYPPDAKVALLLTAPSSDEVVNLKPLCDGRGRYFLREYIHPTGHTVDDLAVSYCLRCRVPYSKGALAYPTGGVRAHAEQSCRTYDGQDMWRDEMQAGGILGWKPDTFLITFDPFDTLKVSAYVRQLHRDVEHAFRMAAEGRRPMLLCGKEAMELVAPYLGGKGGAPAWRGHHWTGAWPFSSAEPPQLMFAPA